MSSQRRTTIYDVTGLRVHTDGRRVNPTGTSSRSRYWGPGTTRDHQGNVIAVDAGGSRKVSRISKGRNYLEEDEEDEEDIYDEGGETFGGESAGEEGEGQSRPSKRKSRKGKDKRPLKRQRFKEDDSFIRTGSSPTSERASTQATSSNKTPLPSAELLKSIHHFAATFYHDRGLLSTAAPPKRNKNKRKVSPERQEDANGDHGGEAGNTVKRHILTKAEKPSFRGPGRPRKGIRERNMYRSFDGSALMAFGVVVQEYIRHNMRKGQPNPNATVGLTSPEPTAEEGHSHVQTPNERTSLDGDVYSLASHTNNLDRVEDLGSGADYNHDR